ncbi:host-nuclease inhibitor Gam family protein [Pelomicrobium methylotrophicum]|uniref:Bacteriophage Mu Gam like protein n=1 Tax=Pelomicrobium methylotrophicum TaxID=2602750 RepID=A0A5C7EX96_9PROT|nr:host-nuclease inhibitor Gam family protein [Pelomicrobium methylotrophicum]TXF11904.1 hypothetical protein FR698_07830 [Pelomicrobium methylotrophicum]
MMTTFSDIERLTRAYADARSELSERVQALQDELEAARRRRLRGIKEAVARAADAHAALKAAIESAPELFQKPRTVTISGIVVGYRKMRGELSWDDPASVVRLIRRHYPDRADALIKVTEVPVKSALAQLTAAELRRIGVHVLEAGDQVLIKPADGDVDKVVDALLRDAEADA